MAMAHPELKHRCEGYRDLLIMVRRDPGTEELEDPGTEELALSSRRAGRGVSGAQPGAEPGSSHACL